MAPVAFLFKRRGIVIVSIEQGDDFDARIERLIEAALEAEAEDFEQNEPEDGVVEVEVRVRSARRCAVALTMYYSSHANLPTSPSLLMQ